MKNKTKHGGRLVANAFKAYGITHVFTLTGGHISPVNINFFNFKLLKLLF